MAAVKDLRRRYGVGWGGVVLYLIFVVAGVGSAELFGDVPTGGAGRGAPLRTFVPLIVFGLGLLGVVLSVCNLPTYLRLVMTDRLDTGDVAGTSGRVVTQGTVGELDGTLTTPVRGAPSVVYTTRVLRNRRDDVEKARESEENWAGVHVGEEVTRFAVDDGTGPVAVDPDGARLYLDEKDDSANAFFEEGDDLPASVKGYLRDVDVADMAMSDAHLRVEEKALEPGEDVYVVGDIEGDHVDAAVVAEDNYETLVRERVVGGAALGGVVSALGYLGLLLAAGAV